MGDYASNGEKIGTCGQGYYATRKALETQAAKGCKESQYYLNPENGCYFAFPFPEYDGKQIGEISTFHEPTNFLIELPPSDNYFHGEIVHHIHPHGGAGVNLFIPCPHSDGAKVSHNFDRSKVGFYLIGEGFYQGAPAVWVECIYCKKKQILDQTEAIEAVKYLRNKAARLKTYTGNESRLHPDACYSTSYDEVNRILEVANRLIQIYTAEPVNA